MRQKQGRLQAPEATEFIAEMPRAAVDKIDEAVLCAPFWAGQAR